VGSPTVKTITLADEVPAIDTVVLAFAGDPIARWSWPTSHQYLTSMPSLVRAFGGNAFSHSGAYSTDDYIGVALWLPPGVQPNEQTLGELIESTVSAALRADAFGMFERMATYHPSAPHWYLPLIGVDPAHQGKGHGDALMTYGLQRCDHDHVAAYLESTNPRNVPLYQRHGFEVLGTIQVGSSPPLVPMLRGPR
jgi:ribosomal protein S18 acetylase RimI-like enzyme